MVSRLGDRVLRGQGQRVAHRGERVRGTHFLVRGVPRSGRPRPIRRGRRGCGSCTRGSASCSAPKVGRSGRRFPSSSLAGEAGSGQGRQYWSLGLARRRGRRHRSCHRDRSLSGPVNVVAPDPPTNAEYTRVLGQRPGPSDLLRRARTGCPHRARWNGRRPAPGQRPRRARAAPKRPATTSAIPSSKAPCDISWSSNCSATRTWNSPR